MSKNNEPSPEIILMASALMRALGAKSVSISMWEPKAEEAPTDLASHGTVDGDILGGFDIALQKLREGYGVRRMGWNGSGLTVYMQRPDANSKMTLPYLYIEYPADHHVTPGARCPWLASQTDLMAMDWVLVVGDVCAETSR